MYVFIYLFIYLSWYSTHRGSIELSVPLDYSPQQTKKLPVKVQNWLKVSLFFFLRNHLNYTNLNSLIYKSLYCY